MNDINTMDASAIQSTQSIDNVETATDAQYPSSDWRSTLAPEYQQAASRFNSPESLLKAYMGAESLIGKKIEAFSREDYKTYSQMMQSATGVPADASGYNIKFSDNQACVLNEDEVHDVKALSAQLGLTTEQAQNLADTVNAWGQACIEDQVRQCAEGFQEMANMWGNAWQTKIEAIDRCVNNVLPQLLGVPADTVKVLLKDACASPTLMNALANLGSLSMNSSSTGYSNLSPMDANLRLEQMRSDPEISKILSNPVHPKHAETRKELQTLLSMRN